VPQLAEPRAEAAPRGEEALEALATVAGDPDLLALLGRVLRRTYATFLGASGREFVDEYLARLEALSPCASLDEMRRAALPMRARFRELGLHRRYTTRFRDENLDRSLRLVGADRLEGHVLDVGADDNRLGERLLRMAPAVRTVTGVDVEERSPLACPPALRFARQPSADTIPLASETVDAAVCRYTLHHVPAAEQEALLLEVRRVLRPGGSCVILENTHSHLVPPSLPDPFGLHASLLALGDRERTYQLLAGLDTFSLGMKDKDMPFPHSFRTVEEWIELLSRVGVEIRACEYHGFPIYDLHQAPFAYFVVRRPARARGRERVSHATSLTSSPPAVGSPAPPSRPRMRAT
jgi:SAM-dependent methyltransferase